jgi:hypothetical protein
MIAHKPAVPRLGARHRPRRGGMGLAAFSRRQSILLVPPRARNVAFALTLAASALTGALVTSAILDVRENGPESTRNGTPQGFALASVGSQTVLPGRAALPQSGEEQGYSEHPQTRQIEASDDLDDGGIPANFPRTVQTVRFVNPQATASIGTVAATAGDAIRRGLAKVGGFVALAPKERAGVDDDKGAAPARKRPVSVMDQVDDYLWEVYRRVPTKKDGTGDFTWKDPAAAKHAGLPLKEYVIGGMDPEFREQLYHAGRAMDAAGLQWSMLSAFRDDYRQGLASGFKASVGNSLHGGSRRTGGYGHGRAIDITGPEGKESEVWRWIDSHGGKYGLHRPLPGADPAHIQQRGDWHTIALALREGRVRSAGGDRPKPPKTAVAAAK